MPLVNAKCTNCGAPLEVDNEKEAAICKYCGSAFIVEKAINYYQTTIVNNYAGATIIAEDGFTKLYEAAQGYKKIEDTKNYLDTLSRITQEYPQKFEGWYGLGINEMKNNLEEIKDIFYSMPQDLGKINVYNNTDKIMLINRLLKRIDSLRIDSLNKASKVANEEQSKMLNAELEKYNNEVSNYTNNITQELQKYEALKQQAMDKLRKMFGTKEAFMTYFKDNDAMSDYIARTDTLSFKFYMKLRGTLFLTISLKEKNKIGWFEGLYYVKNGFNINDFSFKADTIEWGNETGHQKISSCLRFYIENIIEEENKLVLRVEPTSEKDLKDAYFYESILPRTAILTVSPVKKGLLGRLFG